MVCSLGYDDLSDATTIKVWDKVASVKVIAVAKYNRHGGICFSKGRNHSERSLISTTCGIRWSWCYGFGITSTLLVARGVGMVYEPNLVRCMKFGGFIGILVQKL